MAFKLSNSVRRFEMRRIVSLLLGSIVVSGGFTVAHAGDAAAGKAKGMPCFACHGENGVSLLPNYPNLAGQKEQYIVKQLTDFKSGARANPIMAGMVAALSDTDIQDLAAYFSGLGSTAGK
jgi:cytochrome c553